MSRFDLQRDRPFLLYIISYCILFLLGISSFYVFNTTDDKCISGKCDNGYGVYLFGSGMKYAGEWKNGKRHGKGTLTYPDGTKYEGNWKNNRMHGFGIKTSPYISSLKYEGTWENGMKHGKGTQYFSPEEWYEGDWQNGKMHGYGTYRGIGGRTLKGEWKNGYKHGPGTEIYPDGRIFKGVWKNKVKNGIGTMTYPDGTKVEGEWVNNILVGSSDFYIITFEKKSYNIMELCQAIQADINIPLDADPNTTRWLNKLLQVTDLYEKFHEKMGAARFSSEIDALLEDTKDYRSMKFEELSHERKESIKRLNRLLIEHYYPEKTPKNKW